MHLQSAAWWRFWRGTAPTGWNRRLGRFGFLLDGVSFAIQEQLVSWALEQEMCNGTAVGHLSILPYTTLSWIHPNGQSSIPEINDKMWRLDALRLTVP